jgi:hypothetical protein
VARLRGGPVDARGPNVTKSIPLSPASTWIQQPSELQELQVTVDVRQADLCEVIVRVSLDGVKIKTVLANRDDLFAARDFANRSFDYPIFEPESARSHTLSAEITSNTGLGCGDQIGGVLESLKVDVLGFR